MSLFVFCTNVILRFKRVQQVSIHGWRTWKVNLKLWILKLLDRLHMGVKRLKGYLTQSTINHRRYQQNLVCFKSINHYYKHAIFTIWSKMEQDILVTLAINITRFVCDEKQLGPLMVLGKVINAKYIYL